MTEYLSDGGLENFGDKDNLFKLLNELQNRRVAIEDALSNWQERYSDVTNVGENMGMASLLAPLKQESSDTSPQKHRESNKGPKLNENVHLRRRTSSLVERTTEKVIQNENQNEPLCRPFSPSDLGDVETINEFDQYFEVSSMEKEQKNASGNDNDSLLTLLESIRETREEVTVECDKLEKVVSDVSREAQESCSLRERVGMTHRSLTLIEMRQEKVMREALFESVTSNCTIRRLHDEVIQLRIREAQHQEDIQRLMAENNRLKLKLMETRFHGSSAKKAATAAKLPSNAAVCEKQTKDVDTSGAASTSGPGLHEIDDLNKPVCVGAIQRGSLGLFKAKDERGTICVSDRPLAAANSVLRKRKTTCPLCSSVPGECEDEVETTRSVGTSTADIENIVATRNTIVVMGLVLPIPLFLSCLLRTLEESMLMLGRVCFAELPPIDSSFPGLHEEVMQALNEMYLKVKDTVR